MSGLTQTIGSVLQYEFSFRTYHLIIIGIGIALITKFLLNRQKEKFNRQKEKLAIDTDLRIRDLHENHAKQVSMIQDACVQAFVQEREQLVAEFYQEYQQLVYQLQNEYNIQISQERANAFAQNTVHNLIYHVLPTIFGGY